jgi:NAD(P)-dependent dehydrogenase (short-subunit alcohol dehydrogenase family)
MKNFKGKVAAITGAGSGMGREIAIQLAAYGCHLALNDYNEETLEDTITAAAAHGITASKHVFDVSDREKLKAWKDEVLQVHGHVDLLINNAGVAIGRATFDEVKEEDIDWIMGINLQAVIFGTKYFLPYLLERPEAAIVNLSSVFGLFGFPEQVPYCTTKFAVRGFSESLRLELANSNVTVHSIHPGGIKTNITRNARHYAGDPVLLNKIFDEKLARTTAATAATIILKGIRNKEPKILVGTDAHIIDRIARFVPTQWTGKLVRKGFERMARQERDMSAGA